MFIIPFTFYGLQNVDPIAVSLWMFQCAHFDIKPGKKLTSLYQQQSQKIDNELYKSIIAIFHPYHYQ